MPLLLPALRQIKGKNWPVVLEYAESIRDGRKVACKELRQAVDRFFADLDNDEYDFAPKGPEFCIQIIEKTLCHQQGEKLDGTPLRGKPFLLEPFHKFIIYNLLGFKLKGTDVVRFHEALILSLERTSKPVLPLPSHGRCPCGTGAAVPKPTYRPRL